MKYWVCRLCGYLYDESHGVSKEAIVQAARWEEPSREILKPGTPWESVPDDWCCPDCGSEKSFFKQESPAPTKEVA